MIAQAVRTVRARTDLVPDVAVILGTGLGALAEHLEPVARVPYQEIPGFPLATVESHAGRLLLGTLAGQKVVAMQGRFHRYEGYSLHQIAFPIRVLKALGARTLVVSNACGGMHPLWSPGDLMLIADHINLLGDNPLVGPNDDALGPRFPDMSEPYDPELRGLLREAAVAADVPLAEGVYAAVLGPSYETPAEVRFLRRAGADAVGMSTVPEVLAAREQGLRVAAISCLTNHAAGLSTTPLSHAEVVAAGARAAPRLETLVRGFLRALPA